MSASPRPPASDVQAPREVAYEFGDPQKDSFRALAASVSFLGVCAMLLGGISGIVFAGALYSGFLPTAMATVAFGVVCIPAAWWMVSAGRSLFALVGTRGRDVEHLMSAVKHLRRLFGLGIAMLALAVVAGGLVVWCVLVMDRGGKCFGL